MNFVEYGTVTSNFVSQGWQPFQGSCYLLYGGRGSRATWAYADNACRTMASRGRLAMPQTNAANQVVQKLVGRYSAWIGAKKGQIVHEDGRPMNYSNWDEDQPDESSMRTDVCSSTATFMNYWEDVCMPPPWGEGPGDRLFRDPWVRLGFILGISIGVILCLVFTISPCVFAYFYKKKVVDKRQPIVDFRMMPGTPIAHGFRSPLCGCFNDASIFWHAFCCLATRAADTHHTAATEKFWTVIGLWILSLFVGAMFGGGGSFGQAIAGGLMAIFMTGKRAALRTKLGIAPASFFEDCMLWWCCPLCVVAQEAQEVDNAAGVDVKCCFRLMRRNSFSPAGMVGPAVMAGAVMPSQPIVAQIIHIQPPVAGTLAVPQYTGSMISMQPLSQQGA